MASCNDVHDWIENKGFETKEDTIAFVKKDYPNRSDNENLYDCIDTYDFEFVYVVYFHRYPRRKDGTRREGGYYQLSKQQRHSTEKNGRWGRWFVPLGLDAAAKSQVFEHLRSLA